MIVGVPCDQVRFIAGKHFIPAIRADRAASKDGAVEWRIVEAANFREGQDGSHRSLFANDISAGIDVREAISATLVDVGRRGIIRGRQCGDLAVVQFAVVVGIQEDGHAGQSWFVRFSVTVGIAIVPRDSAKFRRRNHLATKVGVENSWANQAARWHVDGQRSMCLTPTRRENLSNRLLADRCIGNEVAAIKEGDCDRFAAIEQAVVVQIDEDRATRQTRFQRLVGFWIAVENSITVQVVPDLALNLRGNMHLQRGVSLCEDGEGPAVGSLVSPLRPVVEVGQSHDGKGVKVTSHRQQVLGTGEAQDGRLIQDEVVGERLQLFDRRHLAVRDEREVNLAGSSQLQPVIPRTAVHAVSRLSGDQVVAIAAEDRAIRSRLAENRSIRSQSIVSESSDQRRDLVWVAEHESRQHSVKAARIHQRTGAGHLEIRRFNAQQRIVQKLEVIKVNSDQRRVGERQRRGRIEKCEVQIKSIATVQGIVSRTTAEHVIAQSAEHLIVPFFALQGIVVGTAVDQVIPGTPIDQVVAVPTGENVVAVPSDNEIIAGSAIHVVVAVTRLQNIVPRAAEDGVVAATAED